MNSLFTVLKAVLAGFFGVRSRKSAEQAPMKVLHIVVIGLLCAVLLAGLLFGVARYLVVHGGGS